MITIQASNRTELLVPSYDYELRHYDRGVVLIWHRTAKKFFLGYRNAKTKKFHRTRSFRDGQGDKAWDAFMDSVQSRTARAL